MAINRTFSIKKLPKDREFRGQQKLIVDFMMAHPQSTIAEITKGIEENLETRQSPERVVGYYMTTMKKKGWVVEEAVQASTEEKTTTGDVAAEEDLDPTEDNPEDEEEEAAVNEEDAQSTGASVQERMEAMAEADLEATSIRLEQSMRVTEAVLKALTGLNIPLTVEGLVTALDAHGYHAKKAQVFGALNNLIRRGVVRRSGESYEVRV